MSQQQQQNGLMSDSQLMMCMRWMHAQMQNQTQNQSKMMNQPQPQPLMMNQQPQPLQHQPQPQPLMVNQQPQPQPQPPPSLLAQEQALFQSRKQDLEAQRQQQQKMLMMMTNQNYAGQGQGQGSQPLQRQEPVDKRKDDSNYNAVGIGGSGAGVGSYRPPSTQHRLDDRDAYIAKLEGEVSMLKERLSLMETQLGELRRRLDLPASENENHIVNNHKHNEAQALDKQLGELALRDQVMIPNANANANAGFKDNGLVDDGYWLMVDKDKDNHDEEEDLVMQM